MTPVRKIRFNPADIVKCENQHLIAQVKQTIYADDIVLPSQFIWYIVPPKDGDEFTSCPICESQYVKRTWLSTYLNIAGKGWV